MATIARSENAKEDISELAAHIARDKVSAAEKFIDAVEKALALLAIMPDMGTLCEFRNPASVGMRVWTIKQFENY